jgi:RNA polymerase sigma-70 factor (ECF subfamily)
MAVDAVRRWIEASLPLGGVVSAREDAGTTVEPALADLDDTALVEAVRAGRRDAFEEIVRRHQRHVYHVCFRFVNRHEDASDLTQEVFLRAWRGLGRFRGQAALATWLHRIAVNASLNRVSVKGLPTEPLDDRPVVDTDAPGPQESLLREERAARVRAAIAKLPPKQRATLVLRAYHDLPHAEIARTLGSSVGAVKANFFHALGNLKRLLSEPS